MSPPSAPGSPAFKRRLIDTTMNIGAAESQVALLGQSMDSVNTAAGEEEVSSHFVCFYA